MSKIFFFVFLVIFAVFAYADFSGFKNRKKADKWMLVFFYALSLALFSVLITGCRPDTPIQWINQSITPWVYSLFGRKQI